MAAKNKTTMKFLILSLDPTTSDIIKAVEEFQGNGHQFVDDLQDADTLIIAPDIASKILFIVGRDATKNAKTFSNWKNLSYRTFFK